MGYLPVSIILAFFTGIDMFLPGWQVKWLQISPFISTILMEPVSKTLWIDIF
jgi:hypothetical protein